MVPALCMRLCAYAAELNPATPVEAVGQWAQEQFRDWAARLEQNETDTGVATLATDPLNLVLGSLALGDPLLASRCVEALIEFWNRCRDAGLSPVSRPNQVAIRAVLGPIDREAAARCLSDPTPDEELLRELSPFGCAAIAMNCRQGRTDCAARLTAEKLAAVGLRSVWMRDLPGVGLSLLASTLLHGRPLPEGLDDWVARIARCDGFIGMWQLYEDAHVRANLLGTVNIYWALAAMAGGKYLGPAHD